MEEVAVADGHRGVGVAVIGALKADEARFVGLTGVVPVAHGDFEGDFERGGAGVGVKDLVKDGGPQKAVGAGFQAVRGQRLVNMRGGFQVAAGETGEAGGEFDGRR